MSTFLNPDDPEWLAVLQRCDHDVYHLPGYVAVEADWVGATPLAYVHRDGAQAMLIPLLERPTPGGSGNSDAVTPYGYSCPVFTRDSGPEFRARGLQRFQADARARGLIATFFRLHPLLMPALDAGADLAWRTVERGVTMTMPIEHDDGAFAAGMARGHRAGIARLREAGCVVEMDTPRAWAAFPGIYRATMERVGATAGYFYDDAYIEAFRTRLGDAVHCAAVIDTDGTPMCAGLFIQVAGILQYHLSGTAEGFGKRAPMKLLLAGMRDWARANGVRHFHLGGGVGARRDSLFEFKQQFGGRELPFRTVSAIHDAAAFEAECAHWRAANGTERPGADAFFPPYRAPAPREAAAA